MKTYNVAVVGATGVVGQSMLAVLAERQFPAARLVPVASARSAGREVEWQDQVLTVQDLATFDFSDIDIALFSAGGNVSKQFAPKAAAAGCVVIDNSSCFRYDDEVPLIIPEVNPEAISESKIIANPNCSTIQMLVALKPIYDAVGIERINVCTYQAVSGSGSEAIAELRRQTQQHQSHSTMTCKAYDKPIAFNVLPHIDSFQDNGYTREEMKMVWETRKIFGDDRIQVNPTAVRVPVFNGHSEAVHIETRVPISATEAKALLKTAAGVTLLEDDYPTPIEQGDGTELVFVGRVREDISHPNGLNLWVVADNIRKGAALNAVQIAELLIRDNHV